MSAPWKVRRRRRQLQHDHQGQQHHQGGFSLVSSPASHSHMNHFLSSTGCSWSHACNSRLLLEEFLAAVSAVCSQSETGVRNDSKEKPNPNDRGTSGGGDFNTTLTFGVEADVLVHPSHSNTPVMCHPPYDASRVDITLSEFIARLDDVIRKDGIPNNVHLIVKLDFKNVEAVRPSLDIINAHSLHAQRNVEVWLNADILLGPGHAQKSRNPTVPPHEFISLCTSALPTCTLSLGWTHGEGTPLGYTPHMAREIVAVTNTLKQHVTLAASAMHLYATPTSTRNELLRHFSQQDETTRGRRTLTLWGPAPFLVRRWFRRLPRDTTYVDVAAASWKAEFAAWYIALWRLLGYHDVRLL